MIQSYPDLVKAKTQQGCSVLILACVNENINIAKQLIKNGADINATNPKGTTVFMYAKTPVIRKHGKTDFLEFLLENGADINAQDNFGKTVLDYVGEKSAVELTQWMISRGTKRGIEIGR